MAFYYQHNGDSLGHCAPFYFTIPSDEWPYRLKLLLSVAPYNGNILLRNLAIPGSTSGQMVGRDTCLTEFGAPDMLSVYTGVNDNGAATTVASAASSTVFTLQAGFGVQYGARSWIVVAGNSRQILSIATDTITLAVALPSTPSVGATVTMDTKANIVQFFQDAYAAGCRRSICVGQHYQNYTPGGDTTSVEATGPAALRVIQKAVVTQLQGANYDIIYIDNYLAMSALITAGTETQNSLCWSAYSTAPGNYHLNSKRTRGGPNGGHDVLALNALGSSASQKGIAAQASWIKAIKAST